MAKKNQHCKRQTSRRRHYMGAVNPSLMNAVYAIAGGAVGQLLDNVLDKNLPATLAQNTKEYIKAGAPIIVGFFLPKMLKSEIGKMAGLGMMTVGGLKLIQATGVLHGIAGVSDFYNAPMLAAASKFLQPGSDYRSPMLAGASARETATMYS